MIARMVLPILAVFFLGCTPSPPGQEPSTPASELPTVTVALPKRGVLVQKTEQPGKIEAFAQAKVHAKVSGFLEKQFVDIGDPVMGPEWSADGSMTKQGQLLAVLSAPELVQELNQKKALVSKTYAEIEQSEAGVGVAQSVVASTEAMLEESRAAVAKFTSELERWQSESKRIDALAATKTVSQKIADETKQNLRATESACAEAEARVRSSQAKYRESKALLDKAIADLQTIQADLDVARAQQQQAQSMCDYLEIRAPFRGVISARFYDLGSLISSVRGEDTKPLYTIVQQDRVRIVFEVPETDAGLVQIGSRALIKIPALQSRTIDGRVARTSWALQESTRTLRCEIDLDNSGNEWRPGMYAQIELIVAEKMDCLSLPKAAVLTADGGKFCLVVSNEGTLAKVPLKTGINSSTHVEVLEGLQGNEQVIVANAGAFRAGQRVQVSPVSP